MAQEPEWKKLINNLANLNGKQADIQAIATSAANTINTQAGALEAVSTALGTILTNLKSTPSTGEIKAALVAANTAQEATLGALKQAQTDALNPGLELLQANVGSVQTATKSITDAQTPPPPSRGGKRRRRTRSKGKKYHKRTKRGGYPYGKGKGKGKKSPKKK